MRKDGKKMKSNSINKFFKRLLTTVLTVSLATIPALSVAPSLTVYADGEYIGGIGGVSQNKTGLLCCN